ncbi:PepSY domain-containing protein [Methylosinus sp. Sm6]|uniref:PepSY domain-containing protein n=1 Tax=Methylosinus sp. Sm6 TaxID=2866948 RepID=UPI001C9A2447|nr:PepSY domain-containing protein [Methylosinus sp. Sm6]MBY6243504.1 PepSY domain-containing protein [Methylosinus sp. Sm6]
MKRYLYLVHRWLGVALCLFMAMWFFSGVVMMYVGYPKLTPSERLSALPSLDPARCCVDLATALAAAGERESPQSVRLTTIGDEPVFVFGWGARAANPARSVAVRARDGRRATHVSAEEALATARAFLGAEGRYDGLVDEDQWTHSKALDGLRPLHRVYMSDPDSTLLYVSAVTGEVARDATRVERIWNWVGAWIHWLYPLRGGWLDAYWRDIVVYSSLVGTALAITGLAVGVMRWRFRAPYKTGARTPYREGVMKWHHLAGLLGGATAVTFVFSGLMSMNPWKIFDLPGSAFDPKPYYGGALAAERFHLEPAQALARFSADGLAAREIELRVIDGEGHYIALGAGGATRILRAAPDAAPSAMLPFDELKRLGARLVPGATVTAATIMESYDFYYFARAPHTMHGNVDKRLPVLRLEFDDPASTWAHIDPYTGAALGRLDSGRRASRWLFAFLHSWDAPALLEARPLWDIFMITLNGAGFALSATGVVIGWRRLWRKVEQRRLVPTLARPPSPAE